MLRDKRPGHGQKSLENRASIAVYLTPSFYFFFSISRSEKTSSVTLNVTHLQNSDGGEFLKVGGTVGMMSSFREMSDHYTFRRFRI